MVERVYKRWSPFLTAFNFYSSGHRLEFFHSKDEVVVQIHGAPTSGALV